MICFYWIALSSKAMSSLETIKSIRDALNKELSLLSDDGPAETLERCQDLLARLEECPMTLDILAETMIGKTVAGLKSNAVLGSRAKNIIKKWKKIAKDAEQSPDSKNADDTASSSQTKKTKSKSSSSSAASKATTKTATMNLSDSEWVGLPAIRQNICQKFMELFWASREELIRDGVNSDAVDQLLAPRAAELERATWSEFPTDKKAYADKARSLAFNLKKNSALTLQLLLGQVTAEVLVKLPTEELASEDIRKKKEEEAKKLLESTRLDWEQANEAKINEMCGIRGKSLAASLFTCGRCKSTKTTSTQKQTRSADEPMTVFVLCLNCGKRWKC